MNELSLDTKFGFIDDRTPAPRIFNPELINNSGRTMLEAITTLLRDADTFVFSVAFITADGLAALKQALLNFRGRGTIITSRYLDFNEPDMFRELLAAPNVDVFVHGKDTSGFHAKGYLFHSASGVTAIVGSTNLTTQALRANEEWNLKFSASHDGDIAFQLSEAVDYQISRSARLTNEWINDYEESRRTRVLVKSDDEIALQENGNDVLVPNPMQAEALEEVGKLYASGERRAVIISSTGTGKTILGAMAARDYRASRLLFLAHQEQILTKAESEFHRVIPESRGASGIFSGRQKDTGANFLFSTIQSMSSPASLAQFHRDHFDYIIIDEVHRSGAESYRRVIEYFRPKFLLGLTATPERTDGFNIFELFDWNVPYEIRLHKALEAKMLVPFHYFGISDYVAGDGTTISDVSSTAQRVSAPRVDYIVDKLNLYSAGGEIKGLIFCARNDEASLLSQALNGRTVLGRTLRTVALSGSNTFAEREDALTKLEQGQLDYILTVDIFNEGIDIPTVNQIVMLRGTASSIIFTQQLGRGLRKSRGKTHLRVFDFIGNYDNNYLIPVALDGSRNKDALRSRVRGTDARESIPLSSTVNFDPVAQQRVLDSLAKVSLDSMKECRNAVQQLRQRLGTVPRLRDYVRFETFDPVSLATKVHNYWNLLAKFKQVELTPGPAESAFLSFLSGEILNGKRPHELLLIKTLMENGAVTKDQYRGILENYGARNDQQSIESTERVLTLDFYSNPPKSYGVAKQGDLSQGNNRAKAQYLSVIEIKDDRYELSQDFADLLSAYTDLSSPESFAWHVTDIIETGLLLNRTYHSRTGDLVLNNQYTRKDVSRLLNWAANAEATMMGYRVDRATSTVPIFVTYHKGLDSKESIRYEDRFTDPSSMRWFTRHGLDLSSREVQSIVSNAATLHLFVKKDDSEGKDFYFLGRARASSPAETEMPIDSTTTVPVVAMDLRLESPVEAGLYNYLHRG